MNRPELDNRRVDADCDVDADDAELAGLLAPDRGVVTMLGFLLVTARQQKKNR